MAPYVPAEWNSIIYRGVESEELDYKAAQDWNALSRSGKAKFVRHCIAMANTKGGYIVVGVGEDSAGRPVDYTGLTEKQSRAFDPTPVGNFINNYVDPELEFTIERPIVDGKRYAIFVVKRFSNMPHVCTYGCEGELLQGVFYIRTAEASSRPAFRSHEMHGLIQRSLRNQREQLGRMLRGILYESNNAFETDALEMFKEQRDLSRNMLTSRRNINQESSISFELCTFPAEFSQKRFTLSEVRDSLEKSVYMFPDPLFITHPEVVESYTTNVSIRSLPEHGLKIWQAFRSGFFHYLEFFPERKAGVDYRRLMLKLAEAMFFAGELYSELGYTEEMLEIDIRLKGVENVTLHGIKPRAGGKRTEYCCKIPEIRINLQRTLADLVSGPEEHALRAMKDICERFNVPSSRHEESGSSLRSYLEERIPEAFRS